MREADWVLILETGPADPWLPQVPHLPCSFCRRPASPTLHLAARRNGARICAACVALCVEIVAERAASGAVSLNRPDVLACALCGDRPPQMSFPSGAVGSSLVAGPEGTYICFACVPEAAALLDLP